jgi:UDP-hydrolysing UDP-N-acetyl-D-glucosamine 2-epimerase
MIKKIAIFTAARSEYGLLKSVIRKLDKRFNVSLLVGGEHFSTTKGFTFNDILEDAIIQREKIIEVDFFIEGNSPKILIQMVAKGQKMFAEIFEEQKFEGILLLGDRFELFAITVPAMIFGIPVFHLNGGEITEGAIDDNIRHATTKMAHLHFVANDIYAKNVSRMGEEDWRIVVSGECGLDNIHQKDIATKNEVQTKFGINLDVKSILITYHPSTLEFGLDVTMQIKIVLSALDEFSAYQLIFTAPGTEIGSEIIIKEIKSFCKKHKNASYIPHFGSRNYLAVMKNVEVVIGNSSSGLIEAASLDKPVVNIGNRQKNRLSATSVLDADYSITEIINSIKKALSNDFKELAMKSINPYDPYQDGKNSDRIVFALENFFENYSPKEQMVKKFDQKISRWDVLLDGFEK